VSARSTIRLVDIPTSLPAVSGSSARPIGGLPEDRLALLRLFRFHAEHGRGALDREALAAAIRAREGPARSLRRADRPGMRRLVVAGRARADTLAVMQEAGILPDRARRRRLHCHPLARRCFEAVVDAGTGYAAFRPRPPSLARSRRMFERLTVRLRLTNAERDRMLAALRRRAQP